MTQRQRAGWIPSRLREHRECAGLTYRMACAELRAVAKRLGLSEPGITVQLMWKHENGHVYPGDDYQRLYCALYGGAPASLGFRPALPGDDDGRRQPHSPAEAGHAILTRASAAVTDDEPLDPPTLSPITGNRAGAADHGQPLYQGPADGAVPSEVGGSGLERQITMAARRALGFTLTAEGSNVGPETIGQLGAEVAALAQAYPREPLSVLLSDLVEIQEMVFKLLDGRQRPEQSRDLYLLAGATSSMLAKASHDIQQPRAAMAQARAAYVCADNAGHDGLRVYVRGLQALVAYWAGWPNEAIRYAQLGVELAGRSRGTSSVWLAASEARAWAVLGNGTAAKAALERAVTARERVVPDELDGFGGLLTFGMSRQLYYTADTTVWLPGEEERAEREAADALSAYERGDAADRSFGDEAGARADLALARANRGELDGARDALARVLDLAPAQRIGGVVKAAMRVHNALRLPRYSDSAAARGIQADIEEFCQVPATLSLP